MCSRRAPRFSARQAELRGSALNAIAVVPVRGSRYDPGSIALQPLGDRAVLDWTIDAAVESSRVKTVGVTRPTGRFSITSPVATATGLSALSVRPNWRD